MRFWMLHALHATQTMTHPGVIADGLADVQDCCALQRCALDHCPVQNEAAPAPPGMHLRAQQLYAPLLAVLYWLVRPVNRQLFDSQTLQLCKDCLWPCPS